MRWALLTVLALVGCRTRPLDEMPRDLAAADLARVDLARVDLAPPDLSCVKAEPVEATPAKGLIACGAETCSVERMCCVRLPEPALRSCQDQCATGNRFSCDGIEDCPCGEDCFGLACCFDGVRGECRLGCIENGGRPLCHRREDCPPGIDCVREPGLPSESGVCAALCR